MLEQLCRQLGLMIEVLRDPLYQNQVWGEFLEITGPSVDGVHTDHYSHCCFRAADLEQTSYQETGVFVE